MGDYGLYRFYGNGIDVEWVIIGYILGQNQKLEKECSFATVEIVSKESIASVSCQFQTVCYTHRLHITSVYDDAGIS